MWFQWLHVKYTNTWNSYQPCEATFQTYSCRFSGSLHCYSPCHRNLFLRSASCQKNLWFGMRGLTSEGVCGSPHLPELALIWPPGSIENYQFLSVVVVDKLTYHINTTVSGHISLRIRDQFLGARFSFSLELPVAGQSIYPCAAAKC